MEYARKILDSLGKLMIYIHLKFDDYDIAYLKSLFAEAKSDQNANEKIRGVLDEINRNRNLGHDFDYSLGLEVYNTNEGYRLNVTGAFEALGIERSGKRYYINQTTSGYENLGRSDQLSKEQKQKIKNSNPNFKKITVAVAPGLLPFMKESDYNMLSHYDYIRSDNSKTWDIDTFMTICMLYSVGYCMPPQSVFSNVHQKLNALMLTKFLKELASSRLLKQIDEAFARSGKIMTQHERIIHTAVKTDANLEKMKKSQDRFTNRNNVLQYHISRLMNKSFDPEKPDFKNGTAYYVGYIIAKVFPDSVAKYLTKKKKKYKFTGSRMNLTNFFAQELTKEFIDHVIKFMERYEDGEIDKFKFEFDRHFNDNTNLLFKPSGNLEYDSIVDNMIISGQPEAAFVSMYENLSIISATKKLKNYPS
ncbi:hypothetical protein L4C36_07370 [Photobacterium japonica]|uniref:hypothetical protein n=1 Tax=Photobacterium japonica TaxID=2910235 RepID=UPI003D0BC337